MIIVITTIIIIIIMITTIIIIMINEARLKCRGGGAGMHLKNALN